MKPNICLVMICYSHINAEHKLLPIGMALPQACFLWSVNIKYETGSSHKGGNQLKKSRWLGNFTFLIPQPQTRRLCFSPKGYLKSMVFFDILFLLP